jgi:hypothetical protein
VKLGRPQPKPPTEAGGSTDRSLYQCRSRNRLVVTGSKSHSSPPARRAVGHESGKCGQSVAGIAGSRSAGSSLYHLRGDKWGELGTKVVRSDRQMKKWSQPIEGWPVRPVRLHPEMLRKFTMGLVVRQGCMGGHRPLRQAAWPGTYDVQPPLAMPVARSACWRGGYERGAGEGCGVATFYRGRLRKRRRAGISCRGGGGGIRPRGRHPRRPRRSRGPWQSAAHPPRAIAGRRPRAGNRSHAGGRRTAGRRGC